MTDSVKESNRKKLHELLDLAIDTNGLEARKKALTGTLPTVFLFFSGHTADMCFEIHTDGWASGSDYDYQKDFFFDREISESAIEDVKSQCMKALEHEDETAVLRRDIEREETKLKAQKELIAEMKKTLRKKERKS